MQPPVQSNRPANRRRPFRLLFVVFALYLLACIGCASFQRRLIYFPPNFPPGEIKLMTASAGLQPWTNSSGEHIGFKSFSAVQPPKGRVLIFYGNGSCAAGCGHYSEVIQSLAPFDVFMMEYPGYPGRPGSPSQKNIFHAADEAIQLMETNAPLYVLGESLGTGVACYVAGTWSNRVMGAVLLAPYTTLTDVAQAHFRFLPVRLFLIDRFPSEKYLQTFRGPVAILVAGQDPVVPERFGRRLFDGYTGPKRLWEFPEGNHGTVMVQPPEIWQQIISFLEANPPHS